MKTGRNIEELGKELLRQRQIRKDFVADTRCIDIDTDEYGTSTMHLALNDDVMDFKLDDLAHSQIAGRLQIPFKYYNRMRMTNPDLLDTNINNWFKKTPEKRMVRTLDNRVRASFVAAILDVLTVASFSPCDSHAPSLFLFQSV